MKSNAAARMNCLKLSFLLLSFLIRNFLIAQEQGNLQGKELLPELDGTQVVSSLADRIRSGNFSGAVTSVKVLEADDLSLTVSIRFTGFDEGFIQALPVDDKKNAIKGFTPQKVPIRKDIKEVTIRMVVDRKQYADNETFMASRLLLTVTKGDRNNGIQALYRLDKKFTIPLSPENMVIAVPLTPVESAATLPKELPSVNASFELPQRKVYMKEKPAFYNQPPAAQKEQLYNSPQAVLSADFVANAKPVMLSNYAAVNRKNPLPYPSEASNATSGSAGTTPSNTDTRAEGPLDEPKQLWGEFITADVDFESQIRVTNVNLNIYPDKNERSGIYYYLPVAYDLKYDREKGFAFHIDYGTSGSDGADNKVRMSGTLTSGITLFESQFINTMLDVFKLQNPQLKIERAVPMPVSETPVITLSEELKNLGIEKVHISNATSVSDPVEFSWHTDGATASGIETLLKANSGITGSMLIKPAGGLVPIQEIPVRIRLMDESTFGRFTMTPSDFRTKNWRNETPFPVRLKYVHYMIIDKNKEGKMAPIIYSWDLGGKVISPRSQAKFDLGTVPAWLDQHNGRQARIWLDYSVVDTCRSCNEQVFRDVVSSTTKSQLSEIVFRMIPFFKDYNIDYIIVQVKSIQGESGGTAEVTFPDVFIKSDSTDHAGPKIYVPEGAAPDFEYRVIAASGTRPELTSRWVKRNALSVPIGSYQFLELFPELKAAKP